MQYELKRGRRLRGRWNDGCRRGCWPDHAGVHQSAELRSLERHSRGQAFDPPHLHSTKSDRQKHLGQSDGRPKNSVGRNLAGNSKSPRSRQRPGDCPPEQGVGAEGHFATASSRPLLGPGPFGDGRRAPNREDDRPRLLACQDGCGLLQVPKLGWTRRRRRSPSGLLAEEEGDDGRALGGCQGVSDGKRHAALHRVGRMTGPRTWASGPSELLNSSTHRRQ